MRLVARLAMHLGARRAVNAIAARVQTPIDRVLMGRSRGRFHTMPAEFPTLLLTTTGRRTGRERTVPLLYVEVGSGVVVTDTGYGREPTPGWSANLHADPSAAATIGPTTRAVRARLAAGEERDRLWAALVALWPNFDRYSARLRRTPRVWVLEPV